VPPDGCSDAQAGRWDMDRAEPTQVAKGRCRPAKHNGAPLAGSCTGQTDMTDTTHLLVGAFGSTGHVFMSKGRHERHDPFGPTYCGLCPDTIGETRPVDFSKVERITPKLGGA
jgi:hypothetical protein